MTVFLGYAGYVELTRGIDDVSYSSIVNSSDVNVAKDRFSFDFPVGMLVTGDKIEIKATDGGLLSFVTAGGWGSGSQQDRGSWYINVDEIGGIKLYGDFGNALNGESTGLVSLATPGRNIPVDVRCVNAGSRILGRVTSYELNNARENVDVTELSDEFRKQNSSLISGNGKINCLFDYRSSSQTYSSGSPNELAVYLHQLVLRQQLGAKFKAKLFVVTQGVGMGAAANDRLWFEFDAVVTNSGISLSPDAVVSSAFDFVTTGTIALKAQTVATGYILQETDDYLLLEQDATGRLELEVVD